MEAFCLDDTHTLVMIPAVCSDGAHNYFSKALIAPNAGSPVTPAQFDAPTGMDGETVTDAPGLINVSYDQTTRQLSTYVRGRGLTDCGVTQQFAKDGNDFHLVEQAEIGECRGSVDCITTSRAVVR